MKYVSINHIFITLLNIPPCSLSGTVKLLVLNRVPTAFSIIKKTQKKMKKPLNNFL